MGLNDTISLNMTREIEACDLATALPIVTVCKTMWPASPFSQPMD